MPDYDRNNVFARILRGEEPCTKVYEDEFALAFENNRPAAPIHVLVIPKGEYVSAADFAASAPPDRLVANHGADANQEIFHLHVHIIGGKRLDSGSAPPSRPMEDINHSY